MLAGDADALEPRSRRPKKLARQTPKPVQDRVIALARTREFTSAHAIAKRLREQGEKITASSVIQILEREGLYGYVPIKDKTGRVVAKKSGLRC